jgi:hypothetical protein
MVPCLLNDFMQNVSLVKVKVKCGYLVGLLFLTIVGIFSHMSCDKSKYVIYIDDP